MKTAAYATYGELKPGCIVLALIGAAKRAKWNIAMAMALLTQMIQEFVK